MKTKLLILIITVILSGCNNKPSGHNSESNKAITDTEIEALIDKLAISDQPAGDHIIFTPSIDTPKDDKRVIAYEAIKKLMSCGKRTFPYLIKKFDDNRQSVAIKPKIPITVGGTCYHIIEQMIFDLPEDYQGSYLRIGADGQYHNRPYSLGQDLFTWDTIEAWLEERKNKSLEEIQIEALEWMIEREKEIGFQNKEDMKEILTPLEKQLKIKESISTHLHE